MASIPSNIDMTDDFRYITINGITSHQKGLIMSGNTPLSIKTPRRQTMNLDGFHGSIDISWQKGALYYDDRLLKYSFAMFVPRGTESNETLSNMNDACENEIQDLYLWVSSLDGLNSDKILDDSGAGRYNQVKFEGMEISKTFKNDMWILSITMEFRTHPEMASIPAYPTPSQVATALELDVYIGRDFSFAGKNSWYDFHLYVSGPTALEDPPIKHNYMTLPFLNGNVNRGVYYEDDIISYKCIFILDNIGNRNEMNRKCQSATEHIMNWLYSVGGSQIGPDNLTMKGTSDLNDSALGKFVFARCTGFSVTKSMSDLYWLLTYDITFTTYPKIVSDQWEE